MTLAEAKQLFGTLIFGSTLIALAIMYIAYKFAEITYKKAHKNVKKVNKSANKNVNVIFDIDSKNKTLQEIQLERIQMRKILGGI